jgi:adenylate cyclase
MQAMTEVIISHGGVVDKLVGDSVMAFWGAPVSQADAAERAVRCSLEMLNNFGGLKKADSRFTGLDIGIGLATGEAIVGNFGGRQRYDYSVVGDTVNLASRLEGLTRQLGVRILCNQDTVAASEGAWLCRDLGFARVKGKSQSVRIVHVVHKDTLEAEFCVGFNQAMAMILNRNFQGAREFLTKLTRNRDDVAAKLYLEKLETLSDREGIAASSDEMVLEFSTK